MLDLKDKKQRKLYNKLGKKILAQALDGDYYFEDDEVEAMLDKALLRFEKRPDWRKAVRSYLWSYEKIRRKICDAGVYVYG